mgnify:CR=1 FL=1
MNELAGFFNLTIKETAFSLMRSFHKNLALFLTLVSCDDRLGGASLPLTLAFNSERKIDARQLI